MSNVRLENLTKKFGDVTAVDSLTLEIGQGEFFSLLGPSGCGKTTTLRMIAGFEFPDSGRIRFDNKDVTFLKPNRRNAGMVFQNFALFPHMTVFENVAFGLQARKIAKSEIRQRVQNALRLVDLEKLFNRRVTELSGGQQQRAALARAIVIEPNILLLDEPLSNLDAKLREETRDEIRRLQQKLGITTIYVTHDQEEALTLSDRMAVMNDGVCHQVGTPEDVYRRPKDRFVATFVGKSNILEGKITKLERGGLEVTVAPDFKIRVERQNNGGLSPGQNVAVSVRPETLSLCSQAENGNDLMGIIRGMNLSGAVADYEIEVGRQRIRVTNLVGPDDFSRKVGSKVRLRIDPERVTLLT